MRRLRENKTDRIVHSTMPRAVETAEMIRKELRKKFGFTDSKKLAAHQAQAERAYKKYFKKPRRDSVEILVCHGNIIRYLVSRALEIDTLTWRRMDIQQCGISVIEISSKGQRTFI